MLLSVVQRKKWEYSRMGIDMSSAFDTIKRSSILELLSECGCDDDELRIVRLLLSNRVARGYLERGGIWNTGGVIWNTNGVIWNTLNFS